jgi:hypothetical protein
MKDRQPTQVLSNGAIRYGVYNADGTLNHYEYLKREDAPTVEGTPLNKANLLSDTTAAKLWPNAATRPEDPTVNDALGKIAEGTAKVGDIAITARTDLSDAWLPCDGRTVSQEQYPKLFSVLRSSAAPLPWALKTSNIQPVAMWYLNGEWVGLHDRKFWISPDLGTWTQQADMPPGLSLVSDVQYANGTYYAVFSGDSTELNGVYTTRSLDTPFALYASGILPGSAGLKMFITPNVLYIYEVGSKYGAYNNYTGREVNASYVNQTTKEIVGISGFISGIVFYAEEKDCFYKLNCSTSGTLKTSKAKTLINPTWEAVSSVNIEELTPSFNQPSTYPYHALMSAYHCGANIIAFFALVNAAFSGAGTTMYSGYMVYRYSADYGATWENGKVVSYKTDSYSLDNYTNGKYENGLLVLSETASESESAGRTEKIIAISAPASGPVYGDVLGSGVDSIALSPDGGAAYISSNGLAYCDYSAAGKEIPTIGTDTRSNAYIKALEE